MLTHVSLKTLLFGGYQPPDIPSRVIRDPYMAFDHSDKTWNKRGGMTTVELGKINEQQIAKILEAQPMFMEEIADKATMKRRTVRAIVSRLEASGEVVRVAGRKASGRATFKYMLARGKE